MSANAAAYSHIIRSDRLRAGDVLLTRGAGKESLSITAVTRGPYSHAAIWLPRVGAAPPYAATWDLQLFESEDLGVGETPLLEAYVTTRDGERFVGRLMADVGAIALLRHPDIADIDAAKLGHAAARLREAVEHLGYSELDRLALAADLLPALREHVARFLRSRDQRDVALVPGPFCSELVAKYFEELGVPLFSEPRPPERVNPSHLAECLLERVPHAILARSSVARLEPIRQIGIPRAEALPAFVRYRSRNIRLKEQVEELEAYFRRSREETMSLQAGILAAQAHEASRCVREAQRHGNVRMAHRLAVTATTQVLALAMIREIRLRRGASAADADSSWDVAEVRLVHLITKMSQRGGVALARQTALLQLSIVRKPRDEGSDATGMNSRVSRTAGIKRWLCSRETDTLTRPLMEKAEETFFHDSGAEAVMDSVFEAACETVTSISDLGQTPPE